MASTLSTLDALLKNEYLPGLPSWVNTQRPLFGRLEKITKKSEFKGRKYIFAAKESDNQGTGAINEGELLPQAGNASIVNMELTMKYYYGVARLSAQVVSASDGDEAAFGRAVTTELNSVRNQIEEDMAIAAVFGDGYGAIGQVSSYTTGTGALVTVDQPTVGAIGGRLIRKNMFLTSYSAKSGGASGGDYKQVSAVNGATATLPTGAGFNASDYLFRAAGTIANNGDPRDKQLMGLGGIVDDGTRRGTFQTLSRTTYPSLKANVLGNSGTLRAWSAELMDQLAMEAWLNGGGGYPTAFYSPLEIQRRAAATLRADRQFDMSVKTYDGGYKAVEWTFPGGQAPWFVDRFCIPNEVHAVHEPDLFMAIQEDLQPEQRDGAMWRITDRTHAYEAWFYTWRNIGARACNNHSALKDVSHTL